MTDRTSARIFSEIFNLLNYYYSEPLQWIDGSNIELFEKFVQDIYNLSREYDFSRGDLCHTEILEKFGIEVEECDD